MAWAKLQTPLVLIALFWGYLFFGWAGLFWMGAIRMVYCLHMQAFVNSLLHRARRTMDRAYNPPSTPRPPDAATASLLRRYISAWEASDIDALLALLKHDAILEMPPIPTASVGHAAIRTFLAGSILDGTPGRWRGVSTEANGGPAVGLYQRDDDTYRFTGLQLLVTEGDRITTITAYMDTSLAERFHLPASVAPR